MDKTTTRIGFSRKANIVASRYYKRTRKILQ